jgi:hypothetical protein
MLIKLQNSLSRLLRLLATTKRYRQSLGGVSAPAGGIGRSEWVLSRPLYRFSRFDLKSVPKPQRSQALALQIRQWAPFANTGCYLLWDQDHAQVWAWDADRAANAMAAKQLKPGSATVVPETLLHQRRSQGVYLLACLDGFEGQVWRDHSLIASRWWPGMPNEVEWINLQRDAASPPELQSKAVPAAIGLQWMEKPWGKAVPLGASTEAGGTAEAWAVPLFVLCLFSWSAWYGVQLIKLNSVLSEQAAELSALTLRAEPVTRARARALDAISRINQLQAIDPYLDQVSLMAKVAETFPKDGAYLKEWEFLNGKLKLLIASPNKLASSAYVKLFQGLGILRNVQAVAAADPANLSLSMEVLPQAEMKLAATTDTAGKKDAGIAGPTPAIPVSK